MNDDDLRTLSRPGRRRARRRVHLRHAPARQARQLSPGRPDDDAARLAVAQHRAGK